MLIFLPQLITDLCSLLYDAYVRDNLPQLFCALANSRRQQLVKDFLFIREIYVRRTNLSWCNSSELYLTFLLARR